MIIMAKQRASVNLITNDDGTNIEITDFTENGANAAVLRTFQCRRATKASVTGSFSFTQRLHSCR